MEPSRDLFPGNADLVPQAPPRRFVPWAEPVMVIVSVAVVAGMLILSHRFEPIFKELGIQLPAATALVLGTGFHALALAAMAGACGWRFFDRGSTGAILLWGVLVFVYVGLVISALFAPLMIIIEQLGAQAGGPEGQ